MSEPKFVHRPRPGPMTRGLGVVAGITAISFAAAWACEQHRRHEHVRILASMPGAANILPALRVHSEMVLKQFGVGVPAKSKRRQS